MIEHVLGSEDPVETGISVASSENGETGAVYVEGPLSLLGEIDDFGSFVPDGFEYVGHRTDPTDSGFGRVTVNYRDIGDAASSATTTPTHTTFRVDMEEEQTPLQQHPDIPEEDRVEIYRWLATDTMKRFDSSGNPQWVDENGTATPVAQPYALKFVACHLRGIETYLRYFPVIEKISTYKRLPGASMNKTSTTGGTVSQYSADLGKFDVPALHLSGYANGGWFKCGDGYVQDQSQKWTRTELWRWTPDYNDTDFNWIYKKSSEAAQS